MTGGGDFTGFAFPHIEAAKLYKKFRIVFELPLALASGHDLKKSLGFSQTSKKGVWLKPRHKNISNPWLKLGAIHKSRNPQPTTCNLSYPIDLRLKIAALPQSG